MNNLLKKLSSVKLTRQEFLVYMGAILVGVLGIPSLLKLVSDVKPGSNTQKLDKLATRTKSRSFGSGSYGV